MCVTFAGRPAIVEVTNLSVYRSISLVLLDSRIAVEKYTSNYNADVIEILVGLRATQLPPN